jgi:ceramide glucosyltransferase
MRTILILVFVVATGTGGEVVLTHAMKQLGEVHDFRPRAIANFVWRAMRSGWLWISIALMATSFFAFLTMLSWYEVSFVVPVTSLAYVAGAFGAKWFLGEKLNATRWAGIALICAGVAMAWFDTVPAPLVPLGVAGALRWAVYALAIAPLAFYAIAIFAAWRFFRVAHHAPALPRDFVPPVSILKPVHGLPDGAYENFASFCRQDYPEYEVLFAVRDAADPAVPVIRQVIADFPQCTARLIATTDFSGANNKVAKLARLAQEARFDLFAISDSDMRVEPDYLRQVAAKFRDPRVGGVTALYRGREARGVVAAMDCVGSSVAFCGAALVAAELEGLKFMMGSTMAFTRERLDEIGGFAPLLDLHSDDYELGRRIAARGYRVELLPEPVWMAFPAMTLAEYLRHELRWFIGIRHIRPAGHLGMIFTHGLPWAVAAAWLAPSPAIAMGWIAAYFIARLAMGWTVGVWGLRDPVLRRKLWLLPVRDFFAFFVWLASFVSNRIEWGGAKFKLQEGRLVPVAAPAPRV